MRIYTILRLMFALFLLYSVAVHSLATTKEAKLFWIAWLFCFSLSSKQFRHFVAYVQSARYGTTGRNSTEKGRR